MCGIIWAKRLDKKQVRKSMRKRYERQKHRGTEGYGFIDIFENKISPVQRSRSEGEMVKKLEEATGDQMLFHHRIPTSTPNLEEATHPIVVQSELLKYDYYGIHNGIISNSSERKKVHEEMGFEYTTELYSQYVTREKAYFMTGSDKFNDSESLIIDLALAIENNKEEIPCRGSIAFIILQVDKESQEIVNLFFGRNNNPLKLDVSKDIITLSSEGSGKEVEPYVLFKWNYTDNKAEKVREISFEGYTQHWKDNRENFEKKDHWSKKDDYGGYSGTKTYKQYHGGTTSKTINLKEWEDDEENREPLGFKRLYGKTVKVEKDFDEDITPEGTIIVNHSSKLYGSSREIFLDINEFYDGYVLASNDYDYASDAYQMAKEGEQVTVQEQMELLDEMLDARKRLTDYENVYAELQIANDDKEEINAETEENKQGA